MTIDSVDLQTTQLLQKTAARKAKCEALEKLHSGKFYLDGLKTSEIIGEENVKVCNNNVIAIDKNTASFSLPKEGYNARNISKNMRQICNCGSTSCRYCISITS
ncbi:hypothetical protein AVEN_176873-1 [Araneus ventricosus]|uniref:Post-SET domain-containing protein n=1 Tax=Araneus ventricosus TaxID=182803 RepID=A0A4Y2SQ11_ARAVE|nr:hypothetical protein AVEN_176873-1 [Araneus ventricosus]